MTIKERISEILNDDELNRCYDIPSQWGQVHTFFNEQSRRYPIENYPGNLREVYTVQVLEDEFCIKNTYSWDYIYISLMPGDCPHLDYL